MNTTSSTTAPGWVRMVSMLLLLWNLFGLYMFYWQYTLSPDRIAALQPAQRTLLDNLPDWMWGVFGVAVVAGTLGALLLVLRRRLALPLFWISLLAVLVQFAQVFFPGGALELMGPANALAMPATVTAVALLQVWLARRAVTRGWLA